MLTFDATQHRYFWDGRPVPGVSELLETIKKPFDSVKWSVHVAKRDGLTVPQVLAAWDKKRDDACDRGHELHEAIEGTLRGELAWTEEANAHPQRLPEFNRWLDWWSLAQMHLEPWAIEHRMCDTKLWVAGTMDVLFLSRKTGKYHVFDWKGMDTKTPLPTPTGWTTMGSVQPGDVVFDETGSPCRVLKASRVHHKRCFRVSFDDRSTLVCDEDHEWMTDIVTVGNKRAVRGIREIAATVKNEKSRPACQHVVPVSAPLVLPEADLPLDPYVLGAWIGDGTRNVGRITKPDPRLWDEIRGRGFDLSKEGLWGVRTLYGLKDALRKTGVLGRKHIPTIYMRASYRQRLDLLRGIMDTDGTWNKKRFQAIHETVDGNMAAQIKELGVTLGIRSTLFVGQHFGYGKEVTRYRVSFANNGTQLFLARPSAVKTTAKASRRIITSVEETPSVATRCIQVDSPSHLFLAGESMIATHNTNAQIRTCNKYGDRLLPPFSDLHDCERDIYALQCSIYRLMAEQEAEEMSGDWLLRSMGGFPGFGDSWLLHLTPEAATPYRLPDLRSRVKAWLEGMR